MDRSVWEALSSLWVVGAFGIIIVVLVYRLVTRSRSNDLIFLGVPPGVIPPPPGNVDRLRSEPPLTVAFTPPEGLTPADGAIILNAHLDADDLILATVVDLAVRGYITIDQPPNSDDPWEWRPILRPDAPPPSSLQPHEDAALRSVFQGSGNSPTGSIPRHMTSRVQAFENLLRDRTAPLFRRPIPSLQAVQAQQYGERPAGWWKRLGLAALAFVFIPGIGGIVAMAILLLSQFRNPDGGTWAGAPGRTAVGRAYYEQVRGFRQFLATADAERLDWEQKQDIFSEYLPWAIALGVADRWTLTFEQLVAEGRYTPRTTWYTQRDSERVVSALRRELGGPRRRSKPILTSETYRRRVKNTWRGQGGRLGNSERGPGGPGWKSSQRSSGDGTREPSRWFGSKAGSGRKSSGSSGFGSKSSSSRRSSRSSGFGSKSRSSSRKSSRSSSSRKPSRSSSSRKSSRSSSSRKSSRSRSSSRKSSRSRSRKR